MPAPTTRSPAFYRIVVAVVVLGLCYEVASGRLAAYLRFFIDAARSGVPPHDDLAGHEIAALVWLACLAPFLYASWEIGRQHVGGRRLGYALLVGMVSVFRIALRGELAPARARAFEDAPSDRVSRAALWGGLVGVLVPTLFLTAAPPLRTARGVLWVCVAGALMGTGQFFRRRALAYLRDDPRGLLRTYRLLNPARYEPRGRAFVKLEILVMLAFAVWWLVAGALLLA